MVSLRPSSKPKQNAEDILAEPKPKLATSIITSARADGRTHGKPGSDSDMC